MGKRGRRKHRPGSATRTGQRKSLNSVPTMRELQNGGPPRSVSPGLESAPSGPSSASEPPDRAHVAGDVGGGTRLFDPLEDVLFAIASGELDEELERIMRVVSDRTRVIRVADAAAVRAQLTVGDRVRINGMVRPKYLQGVWGTVAGWSKSLVVVRLDHPIGRFAGEVRCPAGALDIATKPADTGGPGSYSSPR